TYGISQLPGGWLSDRFGSRIIITIGISGVSLFGLLVGISPTYVVMVVALILMGIAGGGYHPAAIPLLSASVEPRVRGRVLGIHQIGGASSYFMAPLIVAGIASALGWRGAFLMISIPTLIFGLVFFVLLGRWGYGKKDRESISDEQVAAAPAKLNLPLLVPIITLGIASQALVFSTVSFVPLFVVDQFGVSEGAAAALLALVYSAGIWAGPLGGYLSDRLGKVPVILGSCLAAGPILFLLNVVTPGWSISVVLVIVGMVMFFNLPVVESYIVSQTPEHNRSTVLGIYYFGSRGGPGVVAPLLGHMADTSGFYASFNIMAMTMTVIAIGCALFLLRVRHRVS
ncbi:MAG: MFS transporter, partial [Dehalococcoidia bacterium]|nr:MFS transporter [Dehalococcoidia bacterium]